MKKFNLLCLGLMAGATLAGCSDDTLQVDNAQTEAYVRDFIERFGVPDPDHTYCMASRSEVTVKTSTPTDVLITAFVGSKEYLFADYKEVKGTKTIKFDLPYGIENVSVRANNMVFPAKVGDVLSITSDGFVKAASRDGEETSILTGKNVTRIETVEGEYKNTDYLGNEVVINTIELKTEIQDLSSWAGRCAGAVPAAFAKVIYENLSGYKYLDTNKFSRTGQCVPTIDPTGKNSPAMYMQYVRPGAHFEVGIVIGNTETLAGSSDLTLVPFLSTGKEGKTTNMFYRSMDHSYLENSDKRGAEIQFFFGEERMNDGIVYNVHIPASKTQKEEYQNWNFTDESKDLCWSALKTAIENMADLYGNHDLPLPIDVKNGLTYTDVNGNEVSLNDYTDCFDEDGNFVDSPERIWEFIKGYQGYLENQVQVYKDAHPSDSKYNDLLMLKEWFVYCQSYFSLDENDIPEVTRIKDVEGNIIPGAYRVIYRMAKKDDGIMVPEDGAFATNFTSDPYKAVVAMSGGAHFPHGMSEKSNQYAFYFKDLDNDVIHTTADTPMYRYNDGYHYTMDGKSRAGGTGFWIDYDSDGTVDVVFTDLTTHGGAGASYEPFTWLIACEDLGTVGDYDFNDLVAAVQYYANDVTVSDDKFSVYPVAAGGIYPTYLMYNEIDSNNDLITYFVGPEIHKWLGSSDYETMQRTREESVEALFNPDLKVVHTFMKNFSEKESFTMAMGDVTNKPASGNFAGFWVFVDKNNQIEATSYGKDKEVQPIQPGDIAAMQKIFESGSKVANVASKANVPTMLILGEDWEWPQETKSIDSAYEKFGSWISNSSEHWYGIREGKLADGVKREKVVKRGDLEDSFNKAQ